MKIEEIFADNARRQAELDAEEDARLEQARLRRKAWHKLCSSQFGAYRAKALEKVEAYLRDNLVLQHEFVSLVEVDNDTREQGYLLTLKLEGSYRQEEEFELDFSYRFEGDSPETMKVFWNGDPEPKNELDSFHEDW